MIVHVQYVDRYRMVTRAKPVNWPGVRWSAVDDSRLLVGVLEHGIGNWDSIREDSALNLGGKVRTLYVLVCKIESYLHVVAYNYR